MPSSDLRNLLQSLVKRYGRETGGALYRRSIEASKDDTGSAIAMLTALTQDIPGKSAEKLSNCLEGFLESSFFENYRRAPVRDHAYLTTVLYYYLFFATRSWPRQGLSDASGRSIYYPEHLDFELLNLELHEKLKLPSPGKDDLAELILLFAETMLSAPAPEGALKRFVLIVQQDLVRDIGNYSFYLLSFKLVIYFHIGRKVGMGRLLGFLELVSGSTPLSPRDMVPMLFDFYIDDRYDSKHLNILLSLMGTCITAFYPSRSVLIPRIMNLQKDFIRLSGSGSSRYLKIIFELFVENPHLDLTDWIEEGARIIRKHGDSSKSATAYFEKESDLSRNIWKEIDTGIHFDTVKRRLQIFIQAITEKKIILKENRRFPFSSNEDTYFTDGKSIYIPVYVNYVKNRDDNYTVLLHSVAHECAHIEFGSFIEDKTRYLLVSGRFKKLFPGIFQQKQQALMNHLHGIEEEFRHRGFDTKTENTAGGSYLTRLLFHAELPLLLRDLWNVIEDVRVNARLYSHYQGFTRERERVLEIDFEHAIDITSLPLGENLLAAFIQRAVFRKIKGRVREDAKPYLRRIWDIFLSFESREGTDTYDSVLLGGRIYKIVFRFLENRQPELLTRLLTANGEEEADLFHLGIQITGRNSHVDSEIVRLRNLIAEAGGDSDPDESAEEESEIGEIQRTVEKYNYQDEMLIEVGSGCEIYSYPEWEYEKTCYLEDHCRLAEAPIPRWSEHDYLDIRSEYRGYLESVKRAFLRMKPQKFQDRHGMEDGNEIDFDRYIDCLMDLKSGHQMEENFFIFRERRERSVLSALVLDMSPSTRDVIQDSTIFRYEKTAAFLLAEAIDSLGDPFGIFSYFDFGREASIFFTLKPFDIPYSREHENLLLGFQPAVKGYSRLSVGLRHLIHKMQVYDSKSKIIFFITDGFPFYFEGTVDRGERSKVFHIDGTKEVVLDRPVPVLSILQKRTTYIKHDLSKVYEEAVMAGIHLFCITLDENSVDFMGEIFGTSLIYLPRISELPRRLIDLFKKVTT